MKPLGIIVSSVTALMLSGCFFTGVESTPAITARDVKRETSAPLPEDTFLGDVADEPIGSWTPGKPFRVTDERISRIFGATAPAGEALAGKVIAFESVTESPGIAGDPVTDITFVSPAGHRLVYRVNKPLDELKRIGQIEVPFTIQLSAIDAVAGKMAGKRYFILTSLWRDDDDQPVKGKKFVPVTVDSVTPGNAFFPVKVAFTDDEGHSARVFIHPGARGEAPRTFSRVFSFTDPKLRYPAITSERWEMIINGKVAEGMTTEECRLALGTPKEVERGATNSFLREAWLYENGVYLLFEDGLLVRFRR